MNIKLTTSNYITPNCVPRLYMGDALSTLNLGGLSREGIAAFFLVKKIYLVKKIIYDPACDGSFIEERAFPRFEFSLPELVNHLTNTPTFKPALSSSLLRAETSLEFAQSLQQVLAQVDTSKAKLIYFKGGPRSMPVLIGLMCDAALVLDSEILAHYIRCTPTYLFNKNFGSIYEAIKHDSDTPTTFDTSLTIGADPELALFESENILERDEEEISSELLHANTIYNDGDMMSMAGVDGCHSIFEIRPRASSSVDSVVESIEKCIKIIVNKIATSKTRIAKQFFLQSGGGTSQHIGGHIHFGGKSLLDSPNYFMDFIASMMDDFLFWPMRRRMYGASRGWSSIPCVLAHLADRPGTSIIEKMLRSKEAIVNEMIDGAINLPIMSDYDYSHQTRSQPHGFEYRSLPSFIASKEFTKIVLELAMGIGRLVLESVKDKKDINYERPVTEAGYMLFTTQEVFKKFMRYINGDKRDLFLKNVIKEWGINPDRYNKITIENLNVISARPFRHEFEEPLHDISLQINEALSDDGIILNKPIVIYILIIPEESTRVVGDIFSTSHFLLPPTLNKMSLIGSYTQPTQSDEKSIALEALEATVNGQQELVISIFKKNVRDTSLLHNIIVANLAIFARSSLCNGKHIYDILTKRWLLDEEFISFFRMKNLAIPLASEISFDPWSSANTASTMPINGVAF